LLLILIDDIDDDVDDDDSVCVFSNVSPPISSPTNATTLTAAFTNNTDGGLLTAVNAPCKTGELVENKNVIKQIVNNPFLFFF
jgi:hypothetical protein